jgi:hypothetical protein
MSTENIIDIIAGILGGALVAIWAIGVIVGILTIICTWICYKKMGEAGWKSIIPFYCNYILCKHTWGSGWMMLTWLIPFVGNILMLVTYYKLFSNFGKSVLFCILGLVFTPIALAICALGNATYFEDHLM